MIAVLIIDMSDGNETVGQMWKETCVFNNDATLDDVLAWVKTKAGDPRRKHVTITWPEEKP